MGGVDGGDEEDESDEQQASDRHVFGRRSGEKLKDNWSERVLL